MFSTTSGDRIIALVDKWDWKGGVDQKIYKIHEVTRKEHEITHAGEQSDRRGIVRSSKND